MAVEEKTQSVKTLDQEVLPQVAVAEVVEEVVPLVVLEL